MCSLSTTPSLDSLKASATSRLKAGSCKGNTSAAMEVWDKSSSDGMDMLVDTDMASKDESAPN